MRSIGLPEALIILFVAAVIYLVRRAAGGTQPKYPPGTRSCPHCGTKVAQSARFCPECHTEVQ